MSTSITHHRLAELVGGELFQGEPEGLITGLNSISEAEPGDVTFLGNERYLSALRHTRATAALVGLDFAEPLPGLALIRVENPTLAFSSVIRFFGPPSREFHPGVHPSAVVAQSAQFNPERVSIGPCAVIEENVVIGDGTIVHAGVFIGHGARIGMDCVLHPNCTLREMTLLGDRVIIHSGTAIGTDGFGYQFSQGRHQKIEQVGIVQIDNDVEIGSCTTIDRARFGRTWIGEGTKIDNLVQIAHNVVIGQHSIVVSQVGISGSTHIGSHVTIAGQVGIAGHLEISDQVTLLAKAGVTKNITEPGAYTGFPAKPLMEGRRMLSAPAKIPEMMERIRELEKKLAALEKAQA
ncbi:UDP-3-O-(3-hydroxymyristoyl)glucosamine N-acyltransferase [Prosthecobacter algae]|uniref:UDP-3-O-acylglucosamine N-acyltransferase n=1 Tax=Prosthecobacter algae TaxID=1144682 RepID=A0ABP9PBY4_9BACT